MLEDFGQPGYEYWGRGADCPEKALTSLKCGHFAHASG